MSAVLIYGARKSGSTLLQALLDGTPGALCYPYETKFKRLASTVHAGERALREAVLLSDVDPLKRAFGASRRGEALPVEGEVAALLGRIDAGAYFESVARLLEEGPSEAAALLTADVDALAVASGADAGAVPIFKEVGGRVKYVLGLFSVLFPGGHIVIIARDPLNVASAILRDRRKRARRVSVRYILQQSFDAHRHIQRLDSIRREGSSNVTFLTYEQLTRGSTPDTMCRLLARLGLRFSDANLVPTLLGRPHVVRTASEAQTQVFRRDKPWDDGLTVLERTTVRVGAFVARTYSRIKYGRYTPYADLERAIENGS